ncbi:DUF6011 domain-containing protein [Streptomyces sp. NBC_01506]|uniref:DUF6011 domain-containing protein n=1 Tax=Streptomyces sp. NBC_01506 TaxID=2903887 RepID=UPI00386D8850
MCGRPLRTEQSRTRGAGPVCWAATRPRVHRPVAVDITAVPEPIPGQRELELAPHQPTLWSL